MLERRPGSVGIAIPGTEAYVVDEQGARVSPGTVGELVIRGAHVMKGYWNDPQATARSLRGEPGAVIVRFSDHSGATFEWVPLGV